MTSWERAKESQLQPVDVEETPRGVDSPVEPMAPPELETELGVAWTALDFAKQETFEALKEVFDIASAAFARLSDASGLTFSSGVWRDAVLALRAFAENVGDGIVPLDIEGRADYKAHLLAICQRMERRARLLEMQEGIGPAFLMDVHWFGQQGTENDLGLLGQVRQGAEAIDRASAEAVVEAERAIIWRAAEDPQRWVRAMRVAGSFEQLWLVTALISWIVRTREAGDRPVRWGRANTEPVLTMTPEQQRVLLHLLRNGRSAELRAEAAIALGEGGGVVATGDLSQAALSDQSVPVRIQAVRALGLLGGPAALDALGRVLSEEQDEHVLVHSVHSLRHLLQGATAAQTAEAATRISNRLDKPDMPLLPREMAKRLLRPTQTQAA